MGDEDYILISSLEEIAQAGGAHVNLVVSSTGLAAAKKLQKLFGTPYVVGIPVGAELSDMLTWAVNEHNGPVAIRYPRGGDRGFAESNWKPESVVSCHREGDDITIVICKGVGESVLKKISKKELAEIYSEIV